MVAGWLVLAVLSSAVAFILLLLTYLTADGRARFILGLSSFPVGVLAVVAWVGAQWDMGGMTVLVIFIFAFWRTLKKLETII